MRERGLKFPRPVRVDDAHEVAPHAGAWIEIFVWDVRPTVREPVTPHAGAWIEMT